jgi:DNA-directed RNA polymerase specialized sigma24 family protein
MLIERKETKREDLFQEITDAIREWPERDQHIFTRVHYRGQSIEKISSAFGLDVDEVRVILRHCNRKLYAALRKFHKSEPGKAPLVLIQVESPITCRLLPGECNF